MIYSLILQFNKGNLVVTYSGKQISRAGNELRTFNNLSEEQFAKTMDVISFWRQAHEEPVRKALDILFKVVRGVDRSALFARRMKRVPSIYGKLIRYPDMSLYKMNDIGGCRVIIKDRPSLYRVLRELKKLDEFKIKEDGSCKINDYINLPKEDGYRSVHIIGRFPDGAGNFRFVEIQLRTPIQHCWATAVEIVDLFTNQSLKTNQGLPEWANLFVQLSSYFDVMDRIKNFVGFRHSARFDFFKRLMKADFGREIIDRDSSVYIDIKKCNDLLRDLNVVEIFDGFANSINIVDKSFEINNQDGYVLIVIDLKKSSVTAQIFPKADEAESFYKQEELKYSNDTTIVVAMVSTPKLSELRLAYPNYFADSTVFLSCVLCITDYYRTLQSDYFKNAKLSYTRYAF